MKKKETTNSILYIIIPCYNEEEILEITYDTVNNKLKQLINKKVINSKSKIILIDDGSIDNTWKIINKFDENVIGIRLSKNFGHQNALLAGLLYSKDYCDITISMDADMQDDIEVIDEFIKEYNAGNEIVYGVRKDRKTDSIFKRKTAQAFYKIMNKLGANTIYNHADYRLVSKKVLDKLNDYNEVNLFLRGIFPLIGYNSSCVYYTRKKRMYGKTKYSFKKMLNFAIDGITSFSIKPIRLITILGFIIFSISILMLIYSFISFITGRVIAGWTSIMFSIWMIGGLQLLSIGIIGEYLAKTYLETKKRPRYIVDKIINKGK